MPSRAARRTGNNVKVHPRARRQAGKRATVLRASSRTIPWIAAGPRSRRNCPPLGDRSTRPTEVANVSFAARDRLVQVARFPRARFRRSCSLGLHLRFTAVRACAEGAFSRTRECVTRTTRNYSRGNPARDSRWARSERSWSSRSRDSDTKTHGEVRIHTYGFFLFVKRENIIIQRQRNYISFLQASL